MSPKRVGNNSASEQSAKRERSDYPWEVRASAPALPVTERVLPMKILSIILITVLAGSGLLAQRPGVNRKDIYHEVWTDLNKNGRMDVYEDPKAPIERRVEDLLAQMNLDEKTCQTA